MSRDGRDFGSKIGSGGRQSAPYQNMDRRERLRNLALETIDLSKDPFIMKNHIGKIECRLCLTMHNNEGNYLAHTQGKRHKLNLARRKAKERKDGDMSNIPIVNMKKKTTVRKTIKIGKPGYTVTKLRDPETKQKGIFVQVQYTEIKKNFIPRYRFVSAYEQQVDVPQNDDFQYLLVAAEPYETIAFKIPNYKMENVEHEWEKDKFMFNINIQFVKGAKLQRELKVKPPEPKNIPPPPPDDDMQE